MPKESWTSKITQRIAGIGAGKIIMWALALIVAGQCYNNWNLGADIRERDNVIAAQADTIEVHDDSITTLLVVVVEGDRARTKADTAAAQAKRDLKVAERTLSLRPVRTIRVPGDPVVRIVTAAGDTTEVTEDLAGFVEGCNTLAITCADYRVAADLKAKTDSISLAQRDAVIAEHVAKDGAQARKDSTQTEQNKALKKRGNRPPLTLALGPAVVYDLGACGGTTIIISDNIVAQSDQSCDRWTYGIALVGGLDLMWTAETIGSLLSLF